MARLRVLGCSGGIGGGLRTTSLLLNHDILIDAGTGVGDLTVAEMVMIDHVFLTHSHLDHIATLPLLLDSVGAMRDQPLIVHALPETIATLREHIFNWKIWPDFSVIPSAEKPFLRFESIEVGEEVYFNALKLTALPALHTVPAIGYAVETAQGVLAFTGDTSPNDAFWEVINRMPRLTHLIIETAFSNAEYALAELSRHLCPEMLELELAKLQRPAKIYITHLKPGEIDLTMQEIEDTLSFHEPRMLQHGQIIDI